MGPVLLNPSTRHLNKTHRGTKDCSSRGDGTVPVFKLVNSHTFPLDPPLRGGSIPGSKQHFKEVTFEKSKKTAIQPDEANFLVKSCLASVLECWGYSHTEDDIVEGTGRQKREIHENERGPHSQCLQNQDG